MVTINRIYTRSGDNGETGLVGGGRIKKNSLRIRLFGGVDEINSWLGIIRTNFLKDKTISEPIAVIQNELFDIGAELATPSGSEWQGMKKISANHTTQLEKWIDKFSDGVPELKSFVLPGGTEANSYFHIARTVCRRVECDAWELNESEKVSEHILIYLNRLSDLLFALSRYVIHKESKAEFLWKPGGER